MEKNKLQDIGLLIMRVGLGLIFIKHGFGKITGGTQTWQWLGSSMSNLGITFWPTFWGFMAACSEFFGGICLTLGLGTRFAAFFLSCVMFTASVMHWSKGDPFTTLSHPLSLLFVFVGLVLIGGGCYSLDCKLRK